ncbi:MAG: SPOR domain-containing protein [Pseudomonas sp.]
MAWLDKVLKQRMVGALVLVALVVIFLPMLLSRDDESEQVKVDAPTMPQAPAMAQIEVDPVSVPQPQTLPDEPIPGEPDSAAPVELSEPAPPATVTPPAATPAPPVQPAATPVPTPSTPAASPPEVPATAAELTAQKRLDGNGLPVSWSIQLASLSSTEGAQTLQKTLRSQGYNAYIRRFENMNRVFVGPLIERAEADRLRDQLSRQQKLKGFVVRFQPERS